jgi:hypothetical protein
MLCDLNQAVIAISSKASDIPENDDDALCLLTSLCWHVSPHLAGLLLFEGVLHLLQ